MQTLLKVENLTVSFFTQAGEVQAVRGVDFDIRQKETIAIVGESGCGKTVTVQTVMGLLSNPGRVKDGRILFRGEDLAKASRERLHALQGNEMSMIFQDPLTYLNPTMRVGRQIAEAYLQHNKATRDEAAARVLEIMRLVSFPSPERNMRAYPFQLSGGMRQRIMVAMALVCNPVVLFADEPTTALDVTIQAQIIELMNSLKSKIDTAIVLITHDMGVVANMAQRVYVMYAGRIVEHGAAQDVFENPRHPYTWGLLYSIPRLDAPGKGAMEFIPGTPPDLLCPPEGCAFAPRCKHAMNICAVRQPPKYTFGRAEHCAACWLYSEEAKKTYADVIEKRGNANG
ncbi:MAG: ABC transporter ATP-binding protein [Clostridiales bacterium]|nr:ABC transporter ATP-binding protein [Clostridiales bacterium]